MAFGALNVDSQCSWGKSRSVLDRAHSWGEYCDELGYVRVAFGALNVDSQCSWGKSRSVLDRAHSWGEYCDELGYVRVALAL